MAVPRGMSRASEPRPTDPDPTERRDLVRRRAATARVDRRPPTERPAGDRVARAPPPAPPAGARVARARTPPQRPAPRLALRLGPWLGGLAPPRAWRTGL